MPFEKAPSLPSFSDLDLFVARRRVLPVSLRNTLAAVSRVIATSKSYSLSNVLSLSPTWTVRTYTFQSCWCPHHVLYNFVARLKHINYYAPYMNCRPTETCMHPWYCYGLTVPCNTVYESHYKNFALYNACRSFFLMNWRMPRPSSCLVSSCHPSLSTNV